MCSAKDWVQSPPMSTRRNGKQKNPKSRRYKVHVRCLVMMKRSEGTKMESMEVKNLKLYLENKSILEENEKLRQKAILLRQENQALLFEYQKKILSC
ncbi:hypothetical protein KSS87_014425 [Heliosperma pusillum]|nr:hypothetical protein KSS87_014425 [Heliosperma pusillum]